MVLIAKFNQLVQFIKKAIQNYQFEQVNNIIDSIREYSVYQQFVVSFTVVLLYKFFNKIFLKIKLKFDLIPSKTVDDEAPYNLPYITVTNYSQHIPFYKKRIVADLFYFRT